MDLRNSASFWNIKEGVRVRFLEISLIVSLKVKGNQRVYSPDILRFFDDDREQRRVYRTCTERYVIQVQYYVMRLR
jgi:hypothetical protein